MTRRRLPFAVLAFLLPAAPLSAQVKTAVIEVAPLLGTSGAGALPEAPGMRLQAPAPSGVSLILPLPGPGSALPQAPVERPEALPSLEAAAPTVLPAQVRPAAPEDGAGPTAADGAPTREEGRLDGDVQDGRISFDQGGALPAAPGAVQTGLTEESSLSPGLGHRRLVPNVSAAQLVRRSLQEDPQAAAVFSGRLKESPYWPGFQGDLTDELSRALVPRLAARAASAGFGSLESYLETAGGSSDLARAERRALAEFLRDAPTLRTEGWTYIFRDHPLWREPMDRFLDGLIGERRVSKRLFLQSVGAAYGSEAYTLAIVVEQALRRNGEDPAAWNVELMTYDASLHSLLTAGRGLFQPGPKNEAVFKDLDLARYFDPGPGGLLRLKEPLRRWIKTVYIDLNDVNQHPAVLGQSPDVVFANYLLMHLRLGPASALAEHWLSGSWTRRGFLSMAQILVAEIGKPEPGKSARTERPALDAVEGYVGAAGVGYNGDTNNVYGFKGFLRDWWRDKRHSGARAALRRTGELRAALRRDPHAVLKADAAALEYLEALAGRLHLVLTDQDGLTVRWDPDSKTLYAAMGWALPGSDTALLRRLVDSELKDVPANDLGGSGARAPPPLIDHPVLGTGRVALTGRTVRGTFVKFGRFGGKARIWWLSPRVMPITNSYRSDNAAKPADQARQDEAETTSQMLGGGVGIRGLN